MVEKRVQVIPLSNKALDTQLIINRAIYDIEHNYDVRFIHNLCIALDSYKFMLTYDYDPDGTGVASPSIGVVAVNGSEDMSKTEHQLNCAIQDLILSGDKQFLNIFKVGNIYIILFEYRAGGFPIIRIKNSINDPTCSSMYLTKELQDMEEEDGLFPYQSIKIDNDYIMYLCH